MRVVRRNYAHVYPNVLMVVSAPFPQHFAYGVSKLESIYANISTSRMKDTLTTFTAFRTRY